jgi:hypothetical protein
VLIAFVIDKDDLTTTFGECPALLIAEAVEFRGR